MSRTKLLLDVIQDLHVLGISLQALADALMEVESQNVIPNEKEQSDTTPEIKQKKSEITLQEVRAVLVRQSQAGYTEQIRSILTRFDAKKLSEVQPQYYEEVLLLAEELSND